MRDFTQDVEQSLIGRKQPFLKKELEEPDVDQQTTSSPNTANAIRVATRKGKTKSEAPEHKRLKKWARAELN